MRDQDRRHAARLARELAALGVAAAPATAAGDPADLLARKQEAVFAHVAALPRLSDPELRVLVMQIAASDAAHLAALRLAAGEEPVPDAFAGLHRGGTHGMTGEVAELFAAPRTDAALLQAALHVEQVAALAYAAAASGPLTGAERAQALRFAEHERRHAAAFETMLFALTVPVRERAGPADLDALLPGLRARGPARGAASGSPSSRTRRSPGTS